MTRLHAPEKQITRDQIAAPPCAVSIMSQPASRNNSAAEYQNHQNAVAELLQAAAQASAEHESSGESGDENGGEDASPDGAQKGEKRKKRSRACQACRNMKIRCNPVEGQEACLACSKVNRQCVMPGPARKRQKTVHKVAELEKKINALTQSLLAKTQGNPTPQPSPVVTDGSHSAKETNKDSPEERSNFPLFSKSEPLLAAPHSKANDSSYEDVIDRGIVSFAIADRIFDKFMTDLNPLCPLIAFPPGTTAESIRRSRPMLFLAILAAGCVALIPEIHTDLTEELARQFSHRVFFLFERSLDLIQALLIHTTWVGKHKQSKDLGFNQYIHAGIVMAHDLGISRRLKTPLTRDPIEEAELRRTWLGCFWCGMCVSTTLRHPPMINSTPYIEECLTFFEKSPAALPSDRTLCAFVKLIQVMEDVARSFHMHDPASTVKVEEDSTQYSIKIFEKRIEDWKRESTKFMLPGMLNILEATASLYTHEIALHTDHNIDDFRPPSGRPGAVDDEKSTQDFITPKHLDAITKCVCGMKTALDTFVGIFPTPTMRHVPCLFIVWTAYCIVAMIRLDGALRATKSKYAEIFLPDLRIDYYLDAMIERLSGSAGLTATCAPVNMFQQAFQKLKVWHQYRLAGALPAEYADIVDPKTGMHNLGVHIDKFADDKSKGFKGSPSASSTSANVQTPGGVENGFIGMSPAQTEKMRQFRDQQQQVGFTGIINSQGFDTQGGSWLTNSNQPIDASMFENQDWNFTLEDWNNFEASMVQPAGGSWLGYLL